MFSDRIDSLEDVVRLQVAPERLYSATHEEIFAGHTTDVYFVKTRDVLSACGLLETPVTAEIFCPGRGVLRGSARSWSFFGTRASLSRRSKKGDLFARKRRSVAFPVRMVPSACTRRSFSACCAVPPDGRRRPALC